MLFRSLSSPHFAINLLTPRPKVTWTCPVNSTLQTLWDILGVNHDTYTKYYYRYYMYIDIIYIWFYTHIYIYVINIYIYINYQHEINVCIYTWKTVRTIFLSVMGFARYGCFFCLIAYVGFWLWCVVQILWWPRVLTSFDSLPKRNFSTKWSKLEVMIGYPNLATNTAIFPTKFGCTQKILIFFQHHVENNSIHMSTCCPKCWRS
jgi:hypothetical protein